MAGIGGIEMHKCFTSDGMAIACMCVRGEDHDEAHFDLPAGEEPEYEE